MSISRGSQHAVGAYCHTPLPASILTILILTFIFFLSSASATDLPLRGIARGESKIKVGDKAPLIIPELEQAHKEGKVIALQLGYPSHCPWCDKMDRYIKKIMEDTNNFDKKAVFIQTQIEHAKMIAPPPEGVRLKEAFGVEGQPWLFIINQKGIVRFVYKVFVGSDTFKKNIEELLIEEALDEMERAEKKGKKVFATQEMLKTSRVQVGEKVPLTDSLKKVIEDGKAIVLVLLSNPMQCNSCDKLINLLEEEAGRYKNDATYIMAGGRDMIGAVDEETMELKRLYGFVTVGEPWTFIIDKQGVLRKIFIGLFSHEELEEAINGIKGRKE